MLHKSHLPYLDWIDDQQEEMVNFVKKWSNINSYTYNLDGLEMMLEEVSSAFSNYDKNIKIIELKEQEQIDSKGNRKSFALGKALSIRNHQHKAHRILLAGHYDTVYAKDSPFQKAQMIDSKRLNGPGVADMKGGIIILLFALLCIKNSPFAKHLGIEVLLTPDEEIGSPGSHTLYAEAAKRNDIGLIFEPSLPSGDLVSERKGSANYTLVIRGKSAHAGRDFEKGRSAIYALGEIVSCLEKISDLQKDITLNVGSVEGGGALNVVPDLSLCHFNLRAPSLEAMMNTRLKIHEIIQSMNHREGILIDCIEHFTRPPKLFDKRTASLFQSVKTCASELGISLSWKASGGVCDGNILSHFGLPTIDTLGVRGGEIHSPQEFVELDSLPERAKLTALLLIKIANREISIS